MDRDYHSPQPHAYRLDASCPWCRAPLRVRRRRADGERFIGCTAFPGCSYSEPFEAAVQEMGEQLDELAALLHAERAAHAVVPADAIAKDLRALIYEWHPDRHPDPIPAHEVVAELTRLRAAVAA